MNDPHKPKPTDRKPDAVLPDVPETDVPQRRLPEGQIPGLPVSHDPLGQPMPWPDEQEIRPLD